MRVGTNISALQATRYLANTRKALARALERLASGSRINSARDDAAGLAISTGLDSQVRALTQGVRNMNDARSRLLATDGVLETQSEILQRMRELAVQSSNGTLSFEERGYLNGEFQQLLDEFKRNINEAKFSDTSLFNDSSDDGFKIQVGATREESISLTNTQLDLDRTLRTLEFSGTYVDGAAIAFTPANADGSVASADVNGDGHLDVLFTNYASGSNPLYLGNGDGTFHFVSTLSLGNSGATFVDLNNDGNLDVFTEHAHDGNFRIRLGNGDGTFKALQTFNSSFVGAAGRQIFSDFNNDGSLDFSFFNGTGQTIIALGNGDGNFHITQTLPNGSASSSRSDVVMDLNQDGNMDILRTDINLGDTVAFYGNGDGSFFIGATLGFEVTGGQDLNNDGYVDLITRGSSGFNSYDIYINDGQGNFSRLQTLATGGFSIGGISFADMNSDGQIDIINSNAKTVLYLNESGYGTSIQTLTYGGTRPNVADVNEDGFNDILTFSSTRNQVLINLQNPNNVSAVKLLRLDTQEYAQNSLAYLDLALKAVNQARADVGSQLSRFDSAANVTSTTIENLSEARSQILDADYAEETAELVRQQIFEQAGVSVLGQANLQARIVLALLK